MMNDPAYLRAPTLFAAFQQAGPTVAVVTAKDKLRRLLGHGLALQSGAAVSFSAEMAAEASLADPGHAGPMEMVATALPTDYYDDISDFVLTHDASLM